MKTTAEMVCEILTDQKGDKDKRIRLLLKHTYALVADGFKDYAMDFQWNYLHMQTVHAGPLTKAVLVHQLESFKVLIKFFLSTILTKTKFQEILEQCLTHIKLLKDDSEYNNYADFFVNLAYDPDLSDGVKKEFLDFCIPVLIARGDEVRLKTVAELGLLLPEHTANKNPLSNLFVYGKMDLTIFLTSSLGLLEIFLVNDLWPPKYPNINSLLPLAASGYQSDLKDPGRFSMLTAAGYLKEMTAELKKEAGTTQGLYGAMGLIALAFSANSAFTLNYLNAKIEKAVYQNNPDAPFTYDATDYRYVLKLIDITHHFLTCPTYQTSQTRKSFESFQQSITHLIAYEIKEFKTKTPLFASQDEKDRFFKEKMSAYLKGTSVWVSIEAMPQKLPSLSSVKATLFSPDAANDGKRSITYTV